VVLTPLRLASSSLLPGNAGGPTGLSRRTPLPQVLWAEIGKLAGAGHRFAVVLAPSSLRGAGQLWSRFGSAASVAVLASEMAASCNPSLVSWGCEELPRGEGRPAGCVSHLVAWPLVRPRQAPIRCLYPLVGSAA